MAQPDPKTPTRAELFKIFKSHDLVVKIEKLFERAGDTTPTEMEEINISAGIAESKSNQAIDGTIQNEIKSKSNGVLIWLSIR